MSFAGGTADKLGGEYERHWTVNRALAVLRGEADSIKIEAIGEEGVGIEFLLERAGVVEAHQVKRQHTGHGKWTLSALRDEHVLSDFAQHLRAGRYPVFVSADSADDLRELSERAAVASSLEELRRDVLTQTWIGRFETLCSEMSLSEQEALELLPRVTVRGSSDQDLCEWNSVLIERLFDAEPGVALAVLEQVVSSASNLHRTLDVDALWDLLTGAPYDLSRATPAAYDLLAAELDATVDVFTTPLRPLRLAHQIERQELSAAVESLKDDSRSGVLLAGPAGIGKTDLILGVIDQVRAEGWPVLCLRVDRLKATPSTEALGAQLELSGSPTSILDTVAVGGPSLLVIDQLDAVSLASGRLVELWEPVYTLIRQAGLLKGMRVLIACRQFDLQGDWRLRTLSSDEHGLAPVGVSGLSDAQVAEALDAMGISQASLSARQRELLRMPLHLTLLEAIADDHDIPNFETATELLDAYWDRKRRDVARHSGPEIRFGQVSKRLASLMSEAQALSVPAAIVESEDLGSDVDALMSEHVLVKDRNTYGFVHESVFDYVFARNYLADGGRIGELLRTDEQDLFRRAQVRQLLTQQRDANRQRYLDDLKDVLASPDIRFHIKDAVFAWLTSIPNPSQDEADLVREIFLANDQRPLAGPAWRVLVQPVWFDVLDQQGWIERWLASDTRDVDRATRLIGAVSFARPERAAVLVEQYDDRSTDWLNRTAFVVRLGHVHESRRLFDRLLDITRRGAYGDQADHEAWMDAHDLPASQPGWAAELFAVLLERALERSSEHGPRESFRLGAPIDRDYAAQEFITKLAPAAPAEFLDVALPFLMTVIDADLAEQPGWNPTTDHLPRDGIWGWRQVNAEYGFAATLLEAMVVAAQELSRTDPEHFGAAAQVLADRRDDTSQFLLYRALIGNPAEFADLSAEILLEGEWRFQSGYMDQLYWATHELISAIAPHLSSGRAGQLEARFTNYTSEWERSPEGRVSRGMVEFNLLTGLDPALSEKGRLRLLELQRRFAIERPPEPRGIVSGFVQSPITPDEAKRMRDDDWLRAIEKHREDWKDRRTMDLVGGARELASVLQVATQDEPDRFATLGARLPEDTLPTYIEHIMIGLSQPAETAAPADTENIWAFLRHASAVKPGDVFRYLPRVVERYSDQSPPDDIVHMVADIAEHAPNPASDVWDEPAYNGQPYYGGDIWMAGINSDRGAAAEATARLLHKSEQLVPQLEHAVRTLARDPQVSVRASAASAVGAFMRWRREEAVALIPTLVDCDDRLLATHPVRQLIAAAQSTHWPVIEPIVRRMLASAFEDVRRAGASLACVASMYEEDAEHIADSCVTDPDAAIRRGAAEVFATNFRFARFADRCAQSLVILFSDPDAGVREEAGRVFWHLKDDDLARSANVGLAFVASPAFVQDHAHFLHALERSTADVSELTLALAERLLQTDEAELGDIRSRSFADGRNLSILLIRLLASRRDDPAGRADALDWLDRLAEIGAWGVADALAAAER